MATLVDAMERILRNILPLTSHLKSLSHDVDQEFDAETQSKAKTHLKFLTDKNVLATLIFNLDPMLTFKQLSLDFQQRYSTLVGQKMKEMVLRFTIEDLKNFHGENFRKFLKEAICFKQDPVDGAPCDTLENYEKMNVYYNGLQFYDNAILHVDIL